jgi:hypothetical protein
MELIHLQYKQLKQLTFCKNIPCNTGKRARPDDRYQFSYPLLPANGICNA